MSDTLNVTSRGETGSKRMRRLRAAGQIPAVLYGHGEANVNLCVSGEEVAALVYRGVKLVELAGAVKESVFIREVQWNWSGSHIVHLDFNRVSATDRVKVKVPLELRGEAPGLKQGGVVELISHDIEIECPVRSLPDRLYVKITDLSLGQSIVAGKLDLPEGAKLVSPADTVLVQCSAPKEVPEPGVGPAAESAEPELIRKPAKETEGEE